jgi:polyisoprenoid-binding protein YceI
MTMYPASDPASQPGVTPQTTGPGQPAAVPPAGGVTAALRSTDGWAIRAAVLTVTDLAGQQVARAAGDHDGVAATGPLPPGTYTAIMMAPGFTPAARTAQVTASGSAALGTVTLDRTAGITLPPPGQWSIDPVHTSITITARHLGLASVRVQIKRFAGTIDIAEPAERSTVRARLLADSLDTGNKMRDDHLRSADFLDVDVYPYIDYTSTGLTPRGGDHWTMHGALTLHGITRVVELDLTYQGTGADPWGGTRAAFRAQTRLHRDLFGINWNQAVLPGLPQVVGPELQVVLEIEAVQGKLPDMIKSAVGDLPDPPPSP